MKTSLTSVTFRKKSIEEIVDLVAQAGLDAIEWGGDVHVPPTDPEASAKAVGLCREKGIDLPEDLYTQEELHQHILRLWKEANP